MGALASFELEEGFLVATADHIWHMVVMLL